MSSIESASGPKRRRRLSTAVRQSLRDLGVQLAVLNHQVSGHVDIKPVDLQCLDLIGRLGPLSPTALSRHTGLHAATMTGILDRLEKGGWIARERDPSDRRAVFIRALPTRGREIFRLYAGMNASMEEICDGYSESELELLDGFLRRVTDAGRHAADKLAEIH
jgi:DNA-binding MarR family transcriptional regulator